MIKRVTLKNFQVHKNKTFDMTEGLNVIFGDNNQGKSALQRAIYWNFTNKPLGEWMRPKSGKKLLESVCEIEFVDGFTSTRIRGEENKYIINGQEFTELGSETPQVLAEYLGDLTLKLGSKKFYPNFLLPDDSMFMIRESSIVKGSLINYFTGFALIETIKKTISKDVRDNKGVIKGKKSSLKVVTDELLKFDQLDEWSSDNHRIQEFAKKVKEQERKVDLCNMLKKIRDNERTLTNMNNLLTKQIAEKKRAIALIGERESLFRKTWERISQYRSAYAQYNILVRNTVTDTQIKTVKKLAEELEEREKLQKRLRELASTYHAGLAAIVVFEDHLKRIEEEKAKLPDVCPACQRPL